MKNRSFIAAFLFALALGVYAVSPVPAAEGEFHCEVLGLTGNASATDAEGRVRLLQEGDLVAKNETVTTDAGSVLDLAFDKDWKNVTRLEEKSKLKVTSVYPGKLNLTEGAVFARLKSLPRNSSFEVKTPTAVATVRGTEYRTSFVGGRTEVFNVSPSKVYVYGTKADGSADASQELVLERSRKTLVAEAGKAPEPAQALSVEEDQAAEESKAKIEKKIEDVQISGRKSQIQSISEMEAAGKKAEEKKSNPQFEPNPTDESRVTDLRRRPFKKAGGSETA